jgi:hypothetical protein
MKKLLLILILVVVNSSAAAEWTLVQTGKESNEYVDLATIRVSGNLAKMWTLTNISKNIKSIRAGEKAFAVKSVHEYDCKKHQSRLLFVAWYNDYMGIGGIDHSSKSPNSEWKAVAPGIREICWKIACGK